MKKINRIMIAFIVLLLLISGGVVFAYNYIKDLGQKIIANTDITTEKVIEVSSYTSLIENGTDSNYNNYDKVSESATRTILKLTDNITLTNNVALTKDIHLDLNGQKLDLNNYNLTFKHGYAGCFNLYNGTIERGVNGLGNIVIDLPYAGFKSNDLIVTSNSVASAVEDVVTVLNLDSKYTQYSALYVIANAISSDLNERPEFKTYSEVADIPTLTSDLFITKKTCGYNTNISEACSFVYQDLDLPNHYLSTDIEVVYTSSDVDIIDNYGKITKTKYGEVSFTVTIKRNGWEDISCIFNLHVVDISNSAIQDKVGIALIKFYLSKYYVGESLVIREQEVLSDYYYRLNHAIVLPATALGGNITFTYSTTNIKDEANNSIIYRENEADNAYIFEPGLNDYHLVITINNDSTSLNMYSTYVGLEETIAYYIANNLYGGSIIYDKASSSKRLVSITDIMNAAENDALYDLQEYIKSYDITEIKYTLSDEVAAHYKLDNNELTLQNGAIPNDKESSIIMTFTFGTTEFSIELYVEYLDSNGTTLSSYLTYYSIYNASVPSELETSFKLPLATNNIAPYTCYDVASYTTERVGIDETAYTKVTTTFSKPVNLRVALWYDDAEKLVFTYDTNSPTSFTNTLDQHLTNASLTLQDLASKTGDNEAYYLFSIDAQQSLNENTKLVIIYNYKFESSATSWSRYQHINDDLTDNNTTYLNVLGGLFYNTNGQNSSGIALDYAVKDANFFVWIYNKFRPDTSGYSDINAATSDRIIPMDWLGQAAVITKEDTALSGVNDFNGIKYLTSVTEANLSGGRVSDNVLNGISEMKSLNKLILSDCSLKDISSLSKLANQNTLKILDVSNNDIQYFDNLTLISSLEKVYVYNNNKSDTYYGSKGICNYQAFADLMRNGCSVYNDVSNNVPVLYAESNTLDDYRRLKEIAYQEKLKLGSSIKVLYANFKELGTTINGVSGDNRPGNNPFGLQTAGELSWGYQGDAIEGSKYIQAVVTAGSNITKGMYYEFNNGAYSITTDTVFIRGKNYYQLVTDVNAEYFYVTLTYTTGQKLTVKYYVDRF